MSLNSLHVGLYAKDSFKRYYIGDKSVYKLLCNFGTKIPGGIRINISPSGGVRVSYARGSKKNRMDKHKCLEDAFVYFMNNKLKAHHSMEMCQAIEELNILPFEVSGRANYTT